MPPLWMLALHLLLATYLIKVGCGPQVGVCGATCMHHTPHWGTWVGHSPCDISLWALVWGANHVAPPWMGISPCYIPSHTPM